MLADLTGRGDLSPTTVRYAYSVLRIALGRALKEGKVLRNVCQLVDPPAPVRHELSPQAAEQVGVFLAATADDSLGPLYTVAVGTGLRQGELLALRWEDVDLDDATLTVAHTLTRGSRMLAEPKTDRAKRTLRLGSEVLGALREQRRRQLAERLAAGPRWREQGYVFTSSTGAPLDGARVLRTFQRALERARLPRQRFHDLRHATATLLIEAGEELGVVSKVLGHSNIGTTANVYAHLTPAMSQRVADRMDTILRRQETTA
jgi:integrase